MTFTFDNAFISPQALANIRRITDLLQVKHITHRPPAVKQALRDSIERFHTPCTGCLRACSRVR